MGELVIQNDVWALEKENDDSYTVIEKASNTRILKLDAGEVAALGAIALEANRIAQSK